jgi:hypothetical protein
MANRFEHLHSIEAETAGGTWNWAKRLIDELNRLGRVWELANLDLTGKAGYSVVVRADENGFELVP